MKEYHKNELVTVSIDDIGIEGEGIGKVDGFTLFVKDAVPGDVISAKILKSKKTYAYARLEKVETPSPFRMEPVCAFHRSCGGCQLQTLSYEKQLEFKEKKIANNLIRLGGFTPEYVKERMEPIVGMEDPFHYRNKAQYPVGTDKEGHPIAGFYAGRTHCIIANTKCYLGAEENEKIMETILSYMKQNKVSAYDETTGKGLIRHVLIRKSFQEGELMVCIVVNKDIKSLPNQEKLVEALRKIDKMTSVSLSINTENTNVIMGSTIRQIWGSPTISDAIRVRDMKKEGYPCTGEELRFEISPLSFYQVNPIQTEKLYSLALEYAGLTGKETVWDLYCGIGTISLFMARKAKKVYGVEIVPQAIDDARENARNNGIANAEFFVGKAEEVLPAFYEKNIRDTASEVTCTVVAESFSDADEKKNDSMLHPDVIVVDPPRKGCDEACLSTMLKMQPSRIVYVSCDSATLARDLRILVDGGYEIIRIRGVDQFAQTVHVETCVLLSHQKVDKYKTIDYTPDGSYMNGLNKHATYREINEYVQEKYGFKLHSAYIAQVKREMGIEMGENYNLSKSEDYEPKLVTPEKREAIIDALKHFNMI